MAYIGNSPANIQRGRRSVYEFKATAGQTAFSGADLNNQTLDLLEENEMGVYLNGIRLADSDDYSISGDTLTLLSAASLNDQLTVETQTEVANISSYTRTETDARYINYDGDIINGTLQIAGSGNNIELGDNNKAVFGGGDDLQIYHNGSNSYVKDAGTGNLNIITNGGELALLTQGGLEYGVRIIQDGAVEIRHDDSTKLATTTTGVDVTGAVTADGLTVEGATTPLIELRKTGSDKANIKFDTTNGLQFDNSSLNYPIKFSGSLITASTGGSERMRIDSSGKVGIGTSSPSQALHVKSTTSNPTGIGLQNGQRYYAIRSADYSLVFTDATVTQERMRIDSSGRLLVGTTTTRPVQGFDHKVQVEGTGAATASISIVRNTNSVDPPYITFGKTRSGSVGASGIVQQDDVLGRIDFTGANGSNLNSLGARIDARVDGTPGGSDMPTRLTFRTSSDGSAIPAERMRIDSSGKLLIGKTSTSFSTAGHRIDPDGNIEHIRSNNPPLNLSRKSSNGDIAVFYKDSTPAGKIGVTGSQSYIHGGGTDVGVYFGSNNLYPYRSTGLNDATIDLGQSSKRFKDAYLSGGVYLGGTGSANKLDDYEEGTWSPAIYYQNSNDQTNSTNVTQIGRYRKVGNLVVASFYLVWSTSDSRAVDNIGIRNFPFPPKNINPEFRSPGQLICSDTSLSSSEAGIMIYLPNNNTTAIFSTANTGSGNLGAAFGNNNNMKVRATISYLTNT